MRTIALAGLALVIMLTSGSDASATQPVFGASGLEEGPGVLTYRPQGEPCTFTQNEQFDLIPGGAVACGTGGGTTDNQYLRVFDLDDEHGFGGEICVDSLDYAVELSSGGVELTLNVYCVAQGLADTAPSAGIDRDVDLDPNLVFSTTITQPDAQLEYFNQPLGGCCDADLHDMAIEVAAIDCAETGSCDAFFVGTSDFATATKPYYIGAPDCGLVDPVNADAITGLGVQPFVMVVNGTCEDAGDPVPADGPATRAVLLLVLLVAGTRLALRRTAT